MASEQPATMICLVPTQGHQEWKGLRDLLLARGMRLRESDALARDGPTLVLPSVGQAVIVVGREISEQARSRLPAWESLERDLRAYLALSDAPATTKERIQRVAAGFAHISALVVNDLDLAKYLYFEALKWPNVEIVPCGSLPEAAEHVVHLVQAQTLTKKTTQQRLQDAYSKLQTSALSAPPMIGAVWHELGVPDAIERRLNSSDLLEILSGRASQAICEEQYQLTPAQARTVLATLQRNTGEEM